jgi:two-component system sensor histidine kinase RstB
MRPLLLRVAGWVALSIIGSFVALFVLTPPPQPPMVAHLLGAGLGALRDDLIAAEPAEREAVLARWGARVDFPLALAQSGDPALIEPAMTPMPGGLGIRIPLDAEQLLVVGPLPFQFERDGRLAIFHAAAVAAISLLASLVVVWPISRRLAALERASAALRAGALDTRVPVDGNDLIGRVGLAFNTMASALERRMRDREEILEAVAHEVGTPLARIAFQLELLAQATQEDAVLARVEQVRVELGELDQLTTELISWIRLDGQQPARSPLDVCLLAAEAIARSGEDERVHVRLVCGPEPPCAAGDVVWVRRAIENIVRNARRYAHSEAVVTIETVGEEIRIFVDDDGPGIPEDDRERIFDPFTRLDQSRDRAAGGVGLGLAIVRRVMDRHRGRVEVSRSTLGGARFVLVFPVPAA